MGRQELLLLSPKLTDTRRGRLTSLSLGTPNVMKKIGSVIVAVIAIAVLVGALHGGSSSSPTATTTATFSPVADGGCTGDPTDFYCPTQSAVSDIDITSCDIGTDPTNPTPTATFTATNPSSTWAANYMVEINFTDAAGDQIVPGLWPDDDGSVPPGQNVTETVTGDIDPGVDLTGLSCAVDPSAHLNDTF